jgi:transposase
MTFIAYKKIGNKEYAYELTSYWDKKSRQPRHKSKYLGAVIDKEKKHFEKKWSCAKPEKLILDFGDTYILQKVLESAGFVQLLKNAFPKAGSLLPLVFFRLCYCSAMRFAETWLSGNYAKLIYPDASVSSQRISDLLTALGDERLQRTFFAEYIATLACSKKGIIIDTTSLPNQIHTPMTAWGLSEEEINKQIRFMYVIDKDNEVPLFCRYLPGNIVDVSALKNTITELEKFGIKESYAYLDAGFFSEDNIKEMYEAHMNFLTRLPSNRCLYKALIAAEAKSMEAAENIVRYGKRGLLVKQKKVNLFGNEGYAYIVLDPVRRGREMSRLLMQTCDEKDVNKELEYDIRAQGIMILVSSFSLNKEEVVPAYYVRQMAEKMFGFSKDDLDILPLRVHKEEAIRGFLFLQFLSLIAFMHVKNKLGRDYTIEEALLTMRNLKCKVYDDEVLVAEMTKQQKELSEKLGIIVPKRAGI